MGHVAGLDACYAGKALIGRDAGRRARDGFGVPITAARVLIITRASRHAGAVG
jgi:hypothetical protein